MFMVLLKFYGSLMINFIYDSNENENEINARGENVLLCQAKFSKAKTAKTHKHCTGRNKKTGKCNKMCVRICAVKIYNKKNVNKFGVVIVISTQYTHCSTMCEQ